MTEQDAENPFGDSNYAYQTQNKKNPVLRYILILLGIAVALGLGTCVWGLGALLGLASERQSATDIFVDEVLRDGIPGADSGIWSEEAGVTAESMVDVESMVNHYNPGERASDSSCNAETVARTNGPSGTFVMCVTQTSFDSTTGRIETTWKKEAEDWKLYRFYVHYDDATDYYKAQARAEIEAEMAAESED